MSHSAEAEAREETRPTAVGILHFGVGNFHRSHQAMYLDRLTSEGRALEWGICGVGVMPGDAAMRDALRSQDYRYTLVEKHPSGGLKALSIGSIVDFLIAPEDPEAVCARLADPAVRIVSLTITEGGYNILDSTGEFDLDAPQVRADLAEGAVPSTVFALVTEGLRRRREAGTAPFTVMSCDNLPGNGHVARRAFVAFASARDAELGAWIDEHVPFPSSMVDRITPVTTDEDRAMVSEQLGIEDARPVTSEPFVQWVLEDDFAAGRPPLEDVGVQFVPDVAPYETMKLRLLNGGHQVVGHFGRLLGHRFVHEAAGDPQVVALLRRYFAEARATLEEVPGIDLDEYAETLLERFANPAVADTLERLVTDASDRMPKFVVPVVQDQARAGTRTPVATAAIAAWLVGLRGHDDSGAALRIVDRQAEELGRLAELDPGEFLATRTYFGGLGEDEGVREDFLSAYRSLNERGTRETLQGLA